MMTNNKYTRLVKLQKAFFNEHITREIPFRLCALDRLAEALVSRENNSVKPCMPTWENPHSKAMPPKSDSYFTKYGRQKSLAKLGS